MPTIRYLRDFFWRGIIFEKINNYFPNSFNTYVLVMVSAWPKLDLTEIALTRWSLIMDCSIKKEMEILT